MNKEKQRIEIAKACGWSCFEEDTIQYTARRSDGKWGEIPDYTNDLNAMHEAEKSLASSQWQNYLDKLTDSYAPNCKAAVHTTAAQRAEAFLKTLHLWKDMDDE